MASVTITVGDISVGYEDEDEDAKSLNRLAEKTIERLVEKLTKSDDEEADDPAEPDRPADPPPVEYGAEHLKPQRPNEKTPARIRRG